jgi:iron complex outermembrane recepter protein
MFNFDRFASFKRRRARWLSSTIVATALISACSGAEAQDQPTTAPSQATPGQAASNLPPVTVIKPPQRQAPPPANPTRAGTAARRAPARTVQRPPAPPAVTSQRAVTPQPATAPAAVAAGTPGPNLNATAPSATRLGLSLIETPATVEVTNQQTIQDQGYRTTAEIAKGAVGVLDIDSAGAPANFSMRGFTFGAVNVLYNGISVGVASDTTRVMDTANLDQVEFLKGPSALMSGMMAIGGAVNYVSRQPTTGPIQNELDLSVDSLGSVRSHYGSGGSAPVQGFDYRVDITESKINSFVDGDFRDLSDLSAQLNYRVSDTFKTFAAVEYKNDSGHAYWGTPLVPTSFAGSNAVNGVVSGNAFSTFSGDI